MPETDWYSDTAATFGDRLTAAREAAGLDASGLAERLGVDVSSIEAWESDLREPRANRLQMLSGMLGVSLTWLLTGDGEGVAAPVANAAAVSADVMHLLGRLRDLRLQIATATNALAKIEDQLRNVLEQQQ